ncbi:unnamed protein product [Rotaria sp. Silwood2]|nr:unnamed protein product [Rotaria sp. Silwood2]
MYRRLCIEKYKSYITTDEAWFYLDASQGVRDIYYVRSDELPEETDLNVHGKTRLHFIERGSTITSRYYIEHIIEPFIKYVIPRLFSGDTRKKMILHQDSAPGHTAKWTVSYMKEKKIQVMTPAEWLTKSSDTAPMDYSIWSILKERVRKRKMSTLNGLKNAIKQEWENLEQDVIDYALEN